MDAYDIINHPQSLEAEILRPTIDQHSEDEEREILPPLQSEDEEQEPSLSSIHPAFLYEGSSLTVSARHVLIMKYTMRHRMLLLTCYNLSSCTVHYGTIVRLRCINSRNTFQTCSIQLSCTTSVVDACRQL